MTDRHRLSDEEWERLLPILKNTPGIYVVFPARCRQFVEAVLWILRTGSPWRQLSASGLKWNSVFRRFSRWSKHGVWQALLHTLAQEADLQNICIDSSVIRPESVFPQVHTFPSSLAAYILSKPAHYLTS
jgi:transposase